MTDDKKESLLTLEKVGSLVKTWLPIIITVGGMVVGYFVFKAETRHQLEVQNREREILQEQIQSQTNNLQQQIETVRDDINQNRREWQRDMDSRVDILETSNTQILIRLKVLEGRPLD